MDLSNRQIVGLYLFLQKYDKELDMEMKKLQDKLGKHLFAHISIQEIEKLENLYEQGLDVLRD